ncbi:hypothetical protein AB0C40_02250 [Streptomyces brevispora]|uniref:hypothetical protein n=1 Tax=Streptomyces brevispora TaxID=887462 RepID=UPI0033CAFD1E
MFFAYSQKARRVSGRTASGTAEAAKPEWFAGGRGMRDHGSALEHAAAPEDWVAQLGGG